jgi:hypothetical protein
LISSNDTSNSLTETDPYSASLVSEKSFQSYVIDICISVEHYIEKTNQFVRACMLLKGLQRYKDLLRISDHQGLITFAKMIESIFFDSIKMPLVLYWLSFRWARERLRNSLCFHLFMLDSVIDFKMTYIYLFNFITFLAFNPTITITVTALYSDMYTHPPVWYTNG